MNRRTAILHAAEELFAERGYDGTSTSAIAERAGVAHGTVFHHFRTKENLLLELAETLTGSYVEGLERLSPAGGSGWEILERAVRYHFAFMRDYDRGIVVLVQESSRIFGTAVGAGRSAEGLRRGIAAIHEIRRSILVQGMADGSIQQVPLEGTVFLLGSILGGIVNLKARGWMDVPLDLEETAVAFCRRSLSSSG
ncbi:MAG: TetR/AcrR family transcriptional regulator [Deferrisomatales bacterium]|nr:TetR/AcrR family transcriptional regulator [Deferrisomatales bacterium]